MTEDVFSSIFANCEPFDPIRAHAQNCAMVRQILAGQERRKQAVQQMDKIEFETFAATEFRKIAEFLNVKNRNLQISDVERFATYWNSLVGASVTVEEICEDIFNNAADYINAGFYTQESINALLIAYQARLN